MPGFPFGAKPPCGWFSLAAILIACGTAGPDSLGEAHGFYLPQRIVLLGLVASCRSSTSISGAVGTSCGRGVGGRRCPPVGNCLWDYALYSDRTAGQIIRARASVGEGQRIAALLVSTRSRFRANPLLHAVNWLGVGTGNVIWNNYETLHYYFPVQFQPGIDRPYRTISSGSRYMKILAKRRNVVARWEKLLAQHADSIDVVVVWKTDPPWMRSPRWFDRVELRGDVQIYRRRRP